MRPPVALTIAGSDSGGGAGIAADLKTFAAHGVWGTCAITAVTAQNTVGVQAAEVLPPELVTAQIAAVAADIGVAATKTGMLAAPAIVEAVAAAVENWNLHPLVVDPVAVASSGAFLLSPDGLAALRRLLLPLADLVTPNLAEAAALAGWPDPPTDQNGMEQLAEAVLALGPGAVLLTGGHLPGPDAADVLFGVSPGFASGNARGTAGGSGGAETPQAREAPTLWFTTPRVDPRNTHGTGCVLSAAITARLARGEEMIQAVEGAKAFVTAAIAAGVELGAGPGAVNASGSSPP
jgi:hydroxymethylpyrimidine/phosphomethylpyrimidine kinase